MSHQDPTKEGNEFAFLGEPDNEQIPLGDVMSSSSEAEPARTSESGLFAVLRLLIPAVLGGVTVFGVYFLFLDDLLNKPPRPASNRQSQPESLPPQDASNPPPQPTFEDASPTVSNTPPAHTFFPAPSPLPMPAVPSEAQREQAANQALALALRMAGQNASAAGKWFRKVVEEHPNTQAAQKAEDWLKKQTENP